MREEYNGYILITKCKKRFDNRFSVCILIQKHFAGKIQSETFQDEKTSLILEIEAEKESINFGKNIINNRIVRF